MIFATKIPASPVGKVPFKKEADTPDLLLPLKKILLSDNLSFINNHINLHYLSEVYDFFSANGSKDLQSSVAKRTGKSLMHFIGHTIGHVLKAMKSHQAEVSLQSHEQTDYQNYIFRNIKDMKTTLLNIIREDIIQENYDDKKLVMQELNSIINIFNKATEVLAEPAALEQLQEGNINLKLDLLIKLLILLNCVNRYETNKQRQNELGISQKEILTLIEKITCQDFKKSTIKLLNEVATRDTDRIIYLLAHYCDHAFAKASDCLLTQAQKKDMVSVYIHTKRWAGNNPGLQERILKNDESSFLKYLNTKGNEELKDYATLKLTPMVTNWDDNAILARAYMLEVLDKLTSDSTAIRKIIIDFYRTVNNAGPRNFKEVGSQLNILKLIEGIARDRFGDSIDRMIIADYMDRVLALDPEKNLPLVDYLLEGNAIEILRKRDMSIGEYIASNINFRHGKRKQKSKESKLQKR